MKTRFWLGLMVGLLLIVTATSIYGQAGGPGCQDASGGSIPCTPTPALGQPPQDSDFDGISDFNDQCPTEAGLPVNNGCPLPDDLAAAPTNSAPVTFPASVECLVTGYGEAVNMRSGPGIEYEIVNSLPFGSFVITYYLLINGEGEGWYSTKLGWIAQIAVQGNENCASIPVVTTFPSGRTIFIPEALRDFAAAPQDGQGAPPPPGPFCEDGTVVVIDGQAYCRLNLDLAAFPAGGTEGAPPLPPFCEDGEIVVINGQSYCRLILDITIAGGTTEGAPDPGPFCEDGTVVVIDGQAYCRLDLDFTIPADTSEGAPPPPPFCENGEVVIINGGAYCRLNLPLTIGGGTSEGGSPPPGPFCEDGTVVVIDGQSYCRLDLDFTIPSGGVEGGSPPPGPFCEDGEVVVINGQAYCRLILDITIAGGAVEGGSPPPGPFCEDGTVVIIDGQAYCRLDLDLAAFPTGGTEGAPPPPPFCEDGEIVIINGGAYCRLNLPLTMAGGTSDGAPPPDPNECVYYVIIDGNVVCLINEDIDDLAIELPGGEPIRTREHILLARQIGVPATCPVGLLLPAVQKIREAAARMQTVNVQDLIALPEIDDPCVIEVMTVAVIDGVPQTFAVEGGIIAVLDVLRIPIPAQSSSVPTSTRVIAVDIPNSQGATEASNQAQLCVMSEGAEVCTSLPE